MAGAAGWLGCVEGSGRVRKNATNGRTEPLNNGGAVELTLASAISLVYSCASFLAPVSTSLAVSRVSEEEDLNAMLALSRSKASL
jgi:hypothetical protein